METKIEKLKRLNLLRGNMRYTCRCGAKNYNQYTTILDLTRKKKVNRYTCNNCGSKFERVN